MSDSSPPRPGVAESYTAAEVSAILGVSRALVRDWLRAGHLGGYQLPPGRGSRRASPATGYYWSISRDTLLEFIRRHRIKVKTFRLELQPRKARLLAVTDTRSVKWGLTEADPVYEASLFGLGLRLAHTPTWGVLLDFGFVGRDWAYEAAERLARGGDHPYLIAVAGADEAVRPGRPKGLWDVILPPETGPERVAAVIGRLSARAGARQPK